MAALALEDARQLAKQKNEDEGNDGAGDAGFAEYDPESEESEHEPFQKIQYHLLEKVEAEGDYVPDPVEAEIELQSEQPPSDSELPELLLSKPPDSQTDAGPEFEENSEKPKLPDRPDRPDLPDLPDLPVDFMLSDMLGPIDSDECLSDEYAGAQPDNAGGLVQPDAGPSELPRAPTPVAVGSPVESPVGTPVLTPAMSPGCTPPASPQDKPEVPDLPVDDMFTDILAWDSDECPAGPMDSDECPSVTSDAVFGPIDSDEYDGPQPDVVAVGPAMLADDAGGVVQPDAGPSEPPTLSPGGVGAPPAPGPPARPSASAASVGSHHHFQSHSGGPSGTPVEICDDEAPPNCRLRRFEPPDGSSPYWKAWLPTWCMSTNMTRQRVYGETTRPPRTSDESKELCLDWLWTQWHPDPRADGAEVS